MLSNIGLTTRIKNLTLEKKRDQKPRKKNIRQTKTKLPIFIGTKKVFKPLKK